ncbi:3'-5' exonuclease Snipper-like isoform X2 [Periplaneta americana]|uniref:3'-5' exonuclease Snipper-like isoform X2 n=1 Tax=Periplaneta americana TaxID=6978 RepID=UPI0037E92FE8
MQYLGIDLVFRELNHLEIVYVNKNENSLPSLHQPFQFLIIIDFESTCWEDNRNGNQPEIIEFPAVLINTQTGIIEEEFQQYVLPIENPILSEFCTKLTGIKQEMVENGVPLYTCLSLFTRWIREISVKRKLVFHKDKERKDGENSCTFVTWSDWDLSVCLHNECIRKQICKPDILCQWIDLRATYREFYKRRPHGLRGALSELGLQFEGREHSGLCDARNTACLAWRMIQDGSILRVTKSLQTNRKSAVISEKSTAQHRVHCEESLLKGKDTSNTPVTTKPSRQPLKTINTPLTTQARRRPTHTVKKELLSRTMNMMSETGQSPKITNYFQSIRGNATNMKTPVAAVRPGPSSSCKRTPPLCKCGSRASRRVVSLPGPNQGRSFFTCPKRKSLGMVHTSGCGFFRWEF